MLPLQIGSDKSIQSARSLFESLCLHSPFKFHQAINEPKVRLGGSLGSKLSMVDFNEFLVFPLQIGSGEGVRNIGVLLGCFVVVLPSK